MWLNILSFALRAPMLMIASPMSPEILAIKPLKAVKSTNSVLNKIL